MKKVVSVFCVFFCPIPCVNMLYKRKVFHRSNSPQSKNLIAIPNSQLNYIVLVISKQYHCNLCDRLKLGLINFSYDMSHTNASFSLFLQMIMGIMLHPVNAFDRTLYS